MRTIIAFIAIVFTTGLFGQTNIIEKHFSHIADKEDVTQVFVSGRMFGLTKHIPDEGDEELAKIKDFASSVEGFNLIYDDKNGNAGAEYKKGINDLNQYDELLRVRDKSTRFSLHIQEANGIVTELIGIGAIDSAFVVFSLYGHMELEKVGDIASTIQEEGINKITKIKDSGLSEVKVYPNPASVNTPIKIDVPQNLLGGTARVFDANGRQVKTVDINSSTIEINTIEMKSGYHFVELSNGTTTIKRKVLVIE